MEGRRSELEFDELEKLLCEIPNITRVNPQSGGSVPKRASIDDEGKTKIHQSTTVKGVRAEETSLPNDDQYNLASTFSDLSFNRHVAPNNNVKKQTFANVDSSIMVVPSFRPSFYGYDVSKAGTEGTNLSRYNNSASQDLRRRQQVTPSYQPLENFAANVPFPYLPNMSAPGMMSDHRQMFVEPQPRLPYLNSQQASQQHPLSWPNMDKEQLSEMQRQMQYLNLQRLHNQHLENNGNISNRFLSMDANQPHFDVPFSNHQQEPLWNSYTVPRVSNQLNSAFSSSVEFSAMRAFGDKTSKQNYPERFLGRLHGLSMPNGVKFGANESFSHVVPNGKVVPNGGHFVRSVYNSGSYQYADVRPWDVYSDPTFLRSADVKSSPTIRYNSLNEVTGRIYLMAKDQYGCRFLQRKFSEGTREEVEMIFSEIIDHIVDLMTDPFGNYLVQKLLEVCDEDQRMQIVHSITRNEGELVRVSCDMHGTRAVQKIIETLKTAEQFSMIVSSLDYNAVALMKNMNGNHVAQKCLQHLVPEFSKFLYEAATENCVELARDRHGCCVLQKCLGHSDGEQRRRLICEVAANALILSQDPFGNYVVQFVFDLKVGWATQKILDNLEGSFADLSVQKHSSNVVERCLKSANDEQRTCMIQELINNPRFDQIMQDPFGNYVTQAALDKSKGTLYAKLVEAIKPHIGMIRTSPYGKKVLTRLTSKK